MKDQKILGVLLAGIGAIAFSTKAIFIKLAYQAEDIDSLSLLTIRMMFSFPFYVVVLVILWRMSKLSISASDIFKIGFLSVLGYYGASYLDFSGLKYLTASLERLVLFIYPTFVVAINYFFYKKRITSNQLVAIGLTYLGLLVVFSDHLGDSENDQLLTGVALIVSSALAYSVYLIGSERLLKRVGVFTFTSIAMIVSGLAVFTHYLVENQEFEMLNYHTDTYYYGAAIAFFATVIPSFLISKAIALIGSSKVAVVSSLGPVSTVIGAWLFLGESVSITLLIGGSLVVGGVMYLTRKKGNK